MGSVCCPLSTVRSPLVIMLVLLIAALVAAAAAQIPQPCAGPASFTARFRHTDRERNYTVEGKMYYDHENRRIREFEEMDVRGEREAYDRLKLYLLNTEYRVDLHTRKCNVTVPHRSWHPWGVPPEGRYIGGGTIGAVGVPNEQVPIALFGGELFGDRFF